MSDTNTFNRPKCTYQQIIRGIYRTYKANGLYTIQKQAKTKAVISLAILH